MRRTSLGLMILVLLALSGCEQGGDVKFVDFTKTVAVSSPPDMEQDRPVLRGAVGAMISPRETHGIYLQLLAHVSKRLDMALEFIQRKTYAEMNELLSSQEIDLAFTGALKQRLGRFEQADGGTVFLDEIGEIPASAQVKPRQLP